MKAIVTKYHGATQTRSSRITAKDSDNNRVSIPFDHDLDADGNHDAAAKALCKKMNWVNRSLMRGSLKDCNVYVFDDHGNRVRFTEDERNDGYTRARQADLVRRGLA